jgi:hypothetical protein
MPASQAGALSGLRRERLNTLTGNPPATFTNLIVGEGGPIEKGAGCPIEVIPPAGDGGLCPFVGIRLRGLIQSPVRSQ